MNTHTISPEASERILSVGSYSRRGYDAFLLSLNQNYHLTKHAKDYILYEDEWLGRKTLHVIHLCNGFLNTELVVTAEALGLSPYFQPVDKMMQENILEKFDLDCKVGDMMLVINAGI